VIERRSVRFTRTVAAWRRASIELAVRKSIPGLPAGAEVGGGGGEGGGGG